MGNRVATVWTYPMAHTAPQKPRPDPAFAKFSPWGAQWDVRPSKAGKATDHMEQGECGLRESPSTSKLSSSGRPHVPRPSGVDGEEEESGRMKIYQFANEDHFFFFFLENLNMDSDKTKLTKNISTN